jgi:hypothetical protein
MKILIAVLLLGVTAMISRADAPPELKAIEARYDQGALSKDEALREKYIMELATLRMKFAAANVDGWQEVDHEIEQHPAPADADSKALSLLRLGVWHSPRHDYTYKADGTWKMTDGGSDDPDATHGVWSIKGNRYADFVPGAGSENQTYTLILATKETFIFADKDAIFYEKRTLGKGLPLRRDGT